MTVEQIATWYGVDERTARAIHRGADHDGDGIATRRDVADHLELCTTYPESREPTTVYVARDTAGRCLYVGITGARLRRLHAHRESSAWWPEAATVELEHRPTRGNAEARERQLIRELRPVHNIVYARAA